MQIETPSVEQVVTGAGIVGSILYGISLIAGKRQKEIEATNDRLLKLYSEENEIQGAKIDRLEGKVDTLTEIITQYFCPNAPTCTNRPVFDREKFDSLLPE